MKNIKKYKLFDSFKQSDWSWTKDLTIPNDMQLEIHDMSYELRDEGYNVGYQWWPPYEQYNKLYKNNKYPSIRITKFGSDGQEKIDYEHIKDFCDRIISYLDSMGYNGVVKFRKDDTNDYYVNYRIEMISRRVYGNVYE
jgi:hypothetical protein